MKVKRPGLMASLDDLNRRFGRGTVRVALAVLPPASGGSPVRTLWEGKAQWCSPAATLTSILFKPILFEKNCGWKYLRKG
ncbi:hypothetical protein GCM10027511_37260 [Hymenobacter humi]